LEAKMNASAPKRLQPARPVTEERAPYMPRIPWRAAAFALLTLTTVVVGFRWKEARKADGLRSHIVRVHEVELAEARKVVTTLQEKIERLVLSAAQGTSDTQVDPKLHLPGLRSGQGLYLRLAVEDAKTATGIAAAAKAMEPDHIAACLGLSPTSTRGLYEKSEFLLPSWIDEAKKHDDVMTLRVRDEMLSRRIRSDLPSVLGLARAQWLLLVLQEGVNRRDHPVRVFLWGLRDEQLLLRARVQSEGVLLSARIRSKDAPYSPKLPDDAKSRAGASDCSIASQLKALAAEGPPAQEVPATTPSAAATP
jgi:hypothetical protein